MRYMTVCSGIEAPTVAWGPLGWEAVAFSEIEPFPCAVLAHHYPDVPNLGDMRTINGADFRGKIDLLVGGTPCQSFSVAGLRRGLSDERGNLALEFVRIADEAAPDFVVWENVPGVLSDRGNAFGCFLAALAGEDAPLEAPGGKWSGAGYVLGPARTIAWRVLDAQYFGLAQRRKRVFLVGCPRTGADPRKVLFEFDSVRRDTPPSRETGTDIAGTVEASLGRSRGAGTNPGSCVEVCQSLTRSLGSGGPDDNKAQAGFYVPDMVPTLRAGGNRTGGDRPVGTDVDTCESLIVFPSHSSPVSQYGDIAAAEAIQGADASGEITHPVGRNQGREVCVYQDNLYQNRVRRLTPKECERLQGFPDDYTAIVYRGKSAADSSRYKALGNSMAVPVMRWVGKRIVHVRGYH